MNNCTLISHPIACISKMLSPKHQALVAYRRDMFVVLSTVKKKEQYLYEDTLLLRRSLNPEVSFRTEVEDSKSITWLSKLMA